MNEQNYPNQSQGEVEIDLVELFGVLWHHALMLIVAALILGTAAFCYSKFFLPEEFRSTTTIYMLDRSNPDAGTMTNSDLQASAALTKDYAQLITSRHVLELVIENVGLPYGYDDLKHRVSVSTPSDARIVTITVTDNNPRMAQKIADEIRVVGSEHIVNVMEIDAVNVIDEANLPVRKSAPSNTRWAMMGALLGLVAAGAVIILRYILDDTIKTQDDVDRYLGLSTLALIPLDENVGDNQKVTKHKKKSRRKDEEENDDGFGDVTASDTYLHSDEIAAEKKSKPDRRQHPSRAAADAGSPQSSRRPRPEQPAPARFAEGSSVETLDPADQSEPAETGEPDISGDAPRKPDEAAAREERRHGSRPADDTRRRASRDHRKRPDQRPDRRQDSRPDPRRQQPSRDAAYAAAPQSRPDSAPYGEAPRRTGSDSTSSREMNTEELVREAVEASGHSLASEIAVMMDEESGSRGAVETPKPIPAPSHESGRAAADYDNDEDVDIDLIDLD